MAPIDPVPAPALARQFTRSSPQRVIAGVCAGISGHFGVSLAFTRIVFVALAFASGIGIILYLLLILIIPAGSPARIDPGPTVIYAPPPRSARKTFFAYFISICGTLAALTVAYDDMKSVWRFVNGFNSAADESYYVNSPSTGVNSTTAQPVPAVPAQLGAIGYAPRLPGANQPPAMLPQLFGSAEILWSAFGVPHSAVLNMSGPTGFIMASYGGAFGAQSVFQSASIELRDGSFFVRGSGSTVPGYSDDWFQLAKAPDGRWGFSQVCDGAGACYAITGYDATGMEIRF